MALIVLGTVGNSFSPYKVGNTTILASGTFTETGITVEDSCKFMRFWFAGNGSSSYYVTSAFLVQGALSLPITVYGKTSFYVPSYGRASDVMSISNFTTPGEISSVVNIATNQTLPVFNEGTIITSIIETNAYDLSDEWSDLPTSAFPDSSVRGKIIGDGPLVYTLHFTLPAMPPYSGDIGFLGLIFMDSSNTGLALFFENFDGGGMWFGPPDTWGDRVGSILKNVTQDVTMEIDRRDDITGYDYYMRIARQWTSGGTTYTDSFDRTYSCSPGDLGIYDLKNYACNGLFLRGSILSSVAYDVTNLSMTVDLLNDPEEITTTVILAVTCNPTNGDTLTINNSQERVFTFVNYFPLLSTQIQIGTDDYAGTAVNIANKINAIDGAEFSATAVDDGGYYKVTITGHTDTGVTITTTSACITVNDATSIIPSLLQENISASNSMSATDGGKEQSENATVSDVIDVLMEDITESSSASTNFNCLIEILEESCGISDEMDGLIEYMGEEI